MLAYEELQNVILVGHSYGGMVIAGVAAKAGVRLAQLVYLDAFLPEDGKIYAPEKPGFCQNPGFSGASATFAYVLDMKSKGVIAP